VVFIFHRKGGWLGIEHSCQVEKQHGQQEGVWFQIPKLQCSANQSWALVDGRQPDWKWQGSESSKRGSHHWYVFWPPMHSIGLQLALISPLYHSETLKVEREKNGSYSNLYYI